MGRLGRHIAVIIAAIFAISSITIVGNISAQTIPEPSVPKFSLKFVVEQFDIEPTYRINPYTGENETLSPEYHGYTRHVIITVEPQQFNQFTDSKGNLIQLFYNVSLKGSYATEWSHYPDSTYVDLFNASSTGNTIIGVSLEGYPGIPSKAFLDFRLMSVIGHYDYETFQGTTWVDGFTSIKNSVWSNPQTVAVDETSVLPSSSSPTPSSTKVSPSPTVPEFSIQSLLILFVIIPLIAIVILKGKNK